jgi:Rps23 Pro-64 3,4-dihydroxylase Tpa1-like proline 4-hydroxylase
VTGSRARLHPDRRRARGQLQFFGEGGDIVETFVPRWNSLSLFRVPQMHQVTLVTPWAGDDRYSIAGWFRR